MVIQDIPLILHVLTTFLGFSVIGSLIHTPESVHVVAADCYQAARGRAGQSRSFARQAASLEVA